jgi:hypothetical protein
MATIASLIVDVAANTVKLTQDVDKIQGQLSKVDTFAQNLKASLAGAFTIGAATAFVSELIDMGDNIQRLADKTSLSIEQVQRLSYVAMQSGVSMDGMVSAVQNLQQRLGSNDAGAVGAMKALGINVESFLALNPYDQFTTIAEAVGKIEDPTARASIQAAIFGKNWKEIAPVIIANIKQLAAEAPVMGDNTTRALAQMDDSLKKFQLTVKVWAAEAYNFFGRVMDMQVAAIYRLVGGLYDATARVVELASKIPGASKVFGDLTDNVDSLRKTSLWYSDAAKAMAFQNGVATDATKKLTPEAIAAGKAITDAAAAYEKSASAAKKHTTAVRELKNEIIPAIHYTEGWEGAISSFSERVKLTIPVLEDLPKPVAITTSELELLGRQSSLTMKDLIPAAAKKATDSVYSLTKALQQIPQIVVSAFTGGGGTAGAIKGVASAVGAAVGGSIGTAIGGPIGGAIGSALGSLAGPLVGKIGQLLGIGATEYEKRMRAAATETMKLQQQLVAGHGGMAQLIIDADLVGIKITEAFNWEDPEALKNIVGELDQKTQLLNSAMEEYGFSWQDLGDKARSAKLSQLFDDLYAKTDILRTAGIDYHTILERQADDYSKLVQSAIRTGTEIPAAMQQTLQDLVDMGKLVDENGVAFQDLSKISWAKTLTQGFDEVTDAIYQLTDAITRGVGGALDDIGRRVVHPKIEPVYDSGDSASGAATGGIVGNRRVLPFRRGGFVPSGTDTVPAMLTPGEIVLNAAQQRNVSRALTGTDDQPPVVQVFIGNKEINNHIVKVTRKDAATGGLRTRVTAGRSY